ncbi:MAG TPA: tRNA (adenosine(37)-N6)-threonylcarbamoyltransferase complex dimerization subunit type 1 TsaB [Acetobacteraceae bacterium]|nr:tRNA (adenosine(37)-N6)-threonylcarbamoyltransferase complex dimerization subunit type 1 TsaB [Acetobacteraceae bacterium]
MRLLALDGALARCSVALLEDGVLRAAEQEDTARGHASLLPAMVERVLAQAGLRGAVLDAVAVGVGPGGFTGLRAATALATGLALGAGCPVIGVTTGEALVADLPMETPRDRPIWSVVDNRRGGVLLEAFEPGAILPEGAPISLELDALPWPPGPVLVVGDATALVLARTAAGIAAAGGPVLPSAAAIARVAALRLSGAIPPRLAAPLYVEPPSVRPPP